MYNSVSKTPQQIIFRIRVYIVIIQALKCDFIDLYNHYYLMR
jgi:hypothetical protein